MVVVLSTCVALVQLSLGRVDAVVADLGVDAIKIGMIEPIAMTLATVDDDGRPSARVVLLKGLDAQGFAFYTNYQSRKARALAAHPFAAATFWWDRLERSVSASGQRGGEPGVDGS